MTGAVAALLGGSAVQIIITPPTASGVGSGNAVTSNSVTASVAYGSIASGNWVFVSGNPGVTPISPTGFTTAFVSTMLTPEIRTATYAFEGLVNGVVYTSPDVPVTLERV